MAKKAKAMALPAAQTREEAEMAIQRMGEIARDLTRDAADYGDEVAKIKADYELKIAPKNAEYERLRVKVQGWCEANRAELTNDGKVKFAGLATGQVRWRTLPPKVRLSGVDAVIDAIQAGTKRWAKFLRTKVEVNKEAMLADPDLARNIPGVSIGSEGEEFIVEPFQPELSEAA